MNVYYIIKRTGWALATIIGVIIISYVILRLAPGDPARIWAGKPRGPMAQKAIEEARKELGLDKPLVIQVLQYLIQVLRGNLGVSIEYKVPVSSIIWRGLTSTLELLVVAYAIGIPIGVLLGVESALRRGTKLDGILQSIAVILANAPSFWLAIGVIVVLLKTIGFTGYSRVDVKLAIATGFHPITGFYLLDTLLQGNLVLFVDVFSRVLPPALVVATYPMGLGIRFARAFLVENLEEDFVKVAVAWGVNRDIVIWKYAFRGSIPNLTQVFGLAFA
ncbi:MAG TPA: ABC transporter permease, partial [Thermoproteales archaeon]|nr:ABC transporter permease [Thermoproteales archaeon]